MSVIGHPAWDGPQGRGYNVLPSGLYTACFLVAAVLHAGALLGVGKLFVAPAQIASGPGESMEVSLVETAPAAALEVPTEIVPPPAAIEPEPVAPVTPPASPELDPPAPVEAPKQEPTLESSVAKPEPLPKLETVRPKSPEPKSRSKPLASVPAARVAESAIAALPTSTPARAGTAPAATPAANRPGSGASGVTTKATASYQPRPLYPPASRANREQGVVMLRLTIAASGSVSGASLERSSGYPALDQAALAAVRRWRFSPAKAAGLAVTSTVSVPVRFQLDR